MAHRKAGGSAKNLRDSNAQYLGIKLYDGEKTQPGSIIVRQRGSRYLAGENTRYGKDHTIYSLVSGKVKFANKRKKNFDGSFTIRKIVNVVVA